MPMPPTSSARIGDAADHHAERALRPEPLVQQLPRHDDVGRAGAVQPGERVLGDPSGLFDAIAGARLQPDLADRLIGIHVETAAEDRRDRRQHGLIQIAPRDRADLRTRRALREDADNLVIVLVDAHRLSERIRVAEQRLREPGAEHAHAFDAAIVHRRQEPPARDWQPQNRLIGGGHADHARLHARGAARHGDEPLLQRRRRARPRHQREETVGVVCRERG